MQKITPIKTPCIGVCSTGIGDSVCRGCKRFSHEIIDWNAYGNREKQAVISRLQLLLAQVVRDRVVVVDARLLLSELERQQIAVNPLADPLCWVFDLLKAGASQISDLSQFGCLLQRQWQEMPMTVLRDEIDADFYALSSAHYERYFMHNHNFTLGDK